MAGVKYEWKSIDSAPRNGDSFIAYDGNGNGPMHIRWHEPWGEFVLADCLLHLEIEEPSDAPAVWCPVPTRD